MSMEEMLQRPSAWLTLGEPHSPVVVSSRVRLARNIQGAAFPGWAGDEECKHIWQRLEEHVRACPSMQACASAEMSGLSMLDKLILFERHLISREHAARKEGSGIILREDEVLSVMVNEEDHLRLQCMRSGMDLRGTWELVNRLDSEIEEFESYAFSQHLGYLTACPSNVGTGMRASVMLHLPGLVMMNEMSPVAKGMAKIGLAVRGLWGEGSEAAGSMYQVSNQMTLGESETDIIGNLEQIVLEIVEHEKNARVRLMEHREHVLRDQIGRAVGILCNAHVLSSKEALDLLSNLRLGLDMGILGMKDVKVVDDLLILTQPGHLQKMEGRKLKADDRDQTRAMLVRTMLKNALQEGGKKKNE
jgi:protein arginine kinase